jgi:hypothetical protein
MKASNVSKKPYKRWILVVQKVDPRHEDILRVKVNKDHFHPFDECLFHRDIRLTSSRTTFRAWSKA